MQFDLKNHTVLLVVGGSRAYGTHKQTSDLDIKGILIPPLRQYRLGILHRIDQVDSIDELGVFNNLLCPELLEAVTIDSKERHPAVVAPEGAVYDIHKYFNLALDANPNILELVWSEDHLVILETPVGKSLRENRNIFLSKKVLYTYKGYAFSQMKRIRNHRSWLLYPILKEPQRADFGLPPQNSTLSADEQGAFLWVLTEILSEKMANSRLSESTKKELKTISIQDCAAAGIPDKTWPIIQQMTGASDEFISAMMKERQYRNARAQWNSYQSWKKTRNPKRAELESRSRYDTKHASHIARLYCQGKEILETGHLSVTLPKDQREFVIHVRDGGMAFGELEEWFDKEGLEIDEAAMKSILPRAPDRVAANNLLIELQERFDTTIEARSPQ